MRRRLLILAATVAMGSMIPVAASSGPAFSLTLYPAKVVVPLGQREVVFGLLNGGTETERVNVATADGWLQPEESTFTLRPGERHMTVARILIPARHDAGDHDLTISFSVPAADGSATLQVARAVGSVVIIETGGVTVHGVRWDDLRVPRLVDSTLSSPVLLSVKATNRGNVHEVLDPVLGSAGSTVVRFEPTILLRDSSRTLRALWAPPLACWCTVGVRGLQQSVVVFPLRGAGIILVVVVIGLLALRHRRQTSLPGGMIPPSSGPAGSWRGSRQGMALTERDRPLDVPDPNFPHRGGWSPCTSETT